jgi:hypothetical protein
LEHRKEVLETVKISKASFLGMPHQNGKAIPSNFNPP